MSGTTTTGNVIGSGSDSIVLNMSEDQAEGQDAQFTVNVDGEQIGGVQTVTASHAAGQTEPFTFKADLAPGPHDVTVSYLNNLILPGDSGDRNLYVDGLTYDGQTVSDTTTGIYSSAVYPPNSTDGPELGNAVFQVNDTTPVPAGAASTITPTVAPVSVGSGPDTLVLNMAEDYYNGDAQFNVTVDGQQIGGTLTTTAHSTSGQYQEFDVHGDFGGAGTSHTVGVTFLNDAIGGFYPGTTDANDTVDRNLYVLGSSLDGGTPASGIPAEQATDGTTYFSVTAGSNPSATSTGSGLFGTDGVAASANNPAIPVASGSFDSGSSASGSSASGSSASGSSASDSSDSGSSTGALATGGSSDPGASSAGSTTAAPTASGSDSSGSSNGGGDTSSASLASAAAGSGLSTQDFPVPGSGGSSTGTAGSASGSDPASSSGGWTGWWHQHDGTGNHTWTPAGHTG